MSGPADDQFRRAPDPFPENSVIATNTLIAFYLIFLGIYKQLLFSGVFPFQNSLRPDITFRTFQNILSFE